MVLESAHSEIRSRTLPKTPGLMFSCWLTCSSSNNSFLAHNLVDEMDYVNKIMAITDKSREKKLLALGHKPI